MAVHMRNGIQYGGIPNGTVKGVNPSTVPTTVKQLNQIGTVGNIAPVTIPSAVKFSNGDTLETAIGSVATIETSPTVATHEVGEFIFYNGQMYRVIATIAVGETLTVDTNIEATSVGAELTSLNNGLITEEFELTSSYSGVNGNGTYNPITKEVHIIITGSTSSNIPMNTTFCTIPEKYRPTVQKQGGMLYSNDSNQIGAYNMIYANTNGTITQGASSSVRRVLAVFNYVID